MSQFLKSFKYSKQDIVNLLNNVVFAPPDAFHLAGIALEFFQEGSNAPDLGIAATRGFWDEFNKDFVRYSHVVLPPFKEIVSATPAEFGSGSPGLFKYVFFDDATMRRLATYQPDGSTCKGIVFQRIVIGLPNIAGNFIQYQSLLAYPDNDEHNIYALYPTMQDNMAYAIGIPCPPDWRPVAPPAP